jgi:hypothetical protein
MNYYIDTEFLEGTQKKRIFGIPCGNTPPTIDLISIGIVSEDGREYYAISKEFNLEEAWYRYDLKVDHGKPQGFGDKKVYWIRDNVLFPIYQECIVGDAKNIFPFTLKTMKWVIYAYGKSRKDIAAGIKMFVGTKETIGNWEEVKDKMNTKFYGYYANYDWVVFCWIFGKMIDLPKSFPMYCIDLKDRFELARIEYGNKTNNLYWVEPKKHKNYPKQTNEHNALADARWNKQLHEFIKQL